ncbi:MAG: hypothetical protein H6707_17840 [Deltaproteobacteria bacterium]|nr:hypothetical protein [Deltaproteobacteria bacterium]
MERSPGAAACAFGTRLTIILVAVAWVGCSKEQPPQTIDPGKGEGESCTQKSECKTELLCANTGTCEKPGAEGTARRGYLCGESKHCVYGLICSSSNVCTDPGSGSEGAACRGNEDCVKELLCGGLRTCTQAGAANTKTAGQACTKQSECLASLVCYEDECTAPQVIWGGAICADVDAGPLRAYFAVPETDKPLDEFYRLPFPNDIRRKDGKIDVTGHTNPTSLMTGDLDLVGLYLKRISSDISGFGVNTATYLRFSAAVDPTTVKAAGDGQTVQFLDIDKDSPNYGREVDAVVTLRENRGKYICQNSVALRPKLPLAANTTYAVLLRSGIKGTDGKPVAADGDFAEMLKSSAPSDARLKTAWQAYAVLRAYLSDKSIATDALVGGTVFTTMDPRHRMAALREVVRASPAPGLSQITLCDGKTKSPCDDGKDQNHVCPSTVSDEFHELHALYKTPVFQRGTPPFKEPKDGGDIAYDGSNKPQIVRQDDVCVVITVPKAAMPASGWPVTIFGHGTGGNLRTFIGNGVATSLSQITGDQSEVIARSVVVSIDGSMHGPRRNSADPPDELFFNLKNPAASRDNVYQGAADKFQLVRVIESLALSAQDSPTGAAIDLDSARLYYFGHSQGTVEGLPFVAYEPLVKAVVLSGAGGLLRESLLSKRQPVDIASAVRLALSDTNVDHDHALLNIMQLFFEEIDGLNYGAALVRSPPTGKSPRHLLLGSGVADGFTPPSTTRLLGQSINLPQIDQPHARCGDGVCSGDETCQSCAADCTDKTNCGPPTPPFPLISAPVSGNVTVGADKVTAVVSPLASSDGSYDDHFVMLRHPTGVRQAARFLGTAARDGTPTVPK